MKVNWYGEPAITLNTTNHQIRVKASKGKFSDGKQRCWTRIADDWIDENDILPVYDEMLQGLH